jgi:anti-sigma factor RsiW
MPTLRRRLGFRRDHRWTLKHMSAYLDEDLVARGRVRLQRHLDECPECRGVLRSLERMLVRLRRAPSPAISEAPDLVSIIRKRLHEEHVD